MRVCYAGAVARIIAHHRPRRKPWPTVSSAATARKRSPSSRRSRSRRRSPGASRSSSRRAPQPLEEVPARRAAAAAHAEDQRDDEGDDEQHQQHLGDAGGAGGDAAEAEERGDERKDEETDGPAQHDELLSGGDAWNPAIGAPRAIGREAYRAGFGRTSATHGMSRPPARTPISTG